MVIYMYWSAFKIINCENVLLYDTERKSGRLMPGS